MTEAARRERWTAIAVLVFGAVALAFTPIFMRWSGVGPSAAGFWRLAFAAPFFLAMAAIAARPRAGAQTVSPAGRLAFWLLPAAGVFFALDLGFWHTGVKLTSVANATTLGNLAQVFVVGGAWLLFGERPRPAFLAGLALALVGVGLMAATSTAGPGANPHWGDAAAVVGAFWYGCYILAVRKARDAVTATRVMLWTSGAGAPLLLAAALLFREQVMPVGGFAWAACIGLGLVHFLGQGAIAWALGRLPAATASVVILLQPVISAGLGWLWFDEALGSWQAIGGLMALSGVIAAQMSGVRPVARAAPTAG